MSAHRRRIRTLTRREFIAATGSAALSLHAPQLARKPLRFAAITDVHHGLAPDSLHRLQVFVDAVKIRGDLDFVIQLGDFCHTWPTSEAAPFLKLWNSIDLPRYHVLGNHDMDRGSKEEAVRMWGMPDRYYGFVHSGWRFLVLDLNHFKKAGALHPYERGNYFTDGATHNWADPEQLDWLKSELDRSTQPTILVSHQPLGFANADGEVPPEQLEVLKALNGRAAMAMFGHLHVDRLEHHEGLPCFCLNSASYFWQSGMHPYARPLFAFVEVASDGKVTIEGTAGEFVKGRPETAAIGCSASIQNRAIRKSRR